MTSYKDLCTLPKKNKNVVNMLNSVSQHTKEYIKTNLQNIKLKKSMQYTGHDITLLYDNCLHDIISNKPNILVLNLDCITTAFTQRNCG